MTNDNADPPSEPPSPGFFGRIKSIFGDVAAADDDPAAEFEDAGGGDDALSAARRAMIERVIAFDQKRVVDVMAPRADIFAVDIDTPLDTLVRTFADAGHSRMPIYRGDLDDPVGMVHIKDVVTLLSEQPAAKSAETVLKNIRRDLLYAPPSMRITDLLLRMQASRIHMALVIDEYGGTDGLVTIEDLVEEIVGEINDEHDDDDEPAINIAAGGGWIADARVELDDFARETGVVLPVENEEEIDTLGGYVFTLAGRVPQRGEIVSTSTGLDIEIAEADARKVRRLRIRPARRSQTAAAE